jgi:hypothetical protein
MSPKYSRRGYLPRNKPLSNRLRVRKIQSKRKASKRSRPTSPPDHPPRRDHPPRASTRALFRSLRRTFPFDQRGTSQPSTRSLDLTVHSRVRDPAARPPVMKSSIQDFGATACVHVSIVRLRPPAEGAEGADTAVRGAAMSPRTARWIHPGTARSTRDPPPDRPPSRRPPAFTISRNLVAV